MEPSHGIWSGDCYGCSVAAIGRGTQNIRVYPALTMVVVVTSDDFEYETLGKMLDNALLDAEKPLPANPQGVAMLNAQLVKIAQGPGAQPASSLPETARSISGKTYACKSNLGGVNSLRFEFDGLEVADLYMKQNNADVLWPIGLDGEYQLTTQVREYGVGGKMSRPLLSTCLTSASSSWNSNSKEISCHYMFLRPI